MDITFLAPCKDLSGGIKVIATYGNLLVDKGHNVTVVYPQKNEPLRRRFKNSIIKKLKNQKDHLDHFNGRLKQVDSMASTNVPNSDILIATAWETAEWASSLSPEKFGKIFYLIQGYEVWNADKERVEKTLELPFQKIVISSWLKDKVGEIDRTKNISVIPNGADFIYDDNKILTSPRKYTAGMTWSNIPNKNCHIGLEAIKSLTEKLPETRYVIFGSEKPDLDLPENIDFFFQPSRKVIAEIYLSTKVWLSTSNFEGFCLPCLEALSSGAIPVSTDNLGVRDIIDDGVNGYIVDRGNGSQLFEKAYYLATNGDKRRNFMLAGVEKSKTFSWQRSVTMMESLFTKALGAKQ